MGCAKPAPIGCKLLELLCLDFLVQSLRSPAVVSILMTLLGVWSDMPLAVLRRVIFRSS